MSDHDHGFHYKTIDEAAEDKAILYSSDVARFTGLTVRGVRKKANNPADDFPASTDISVRRHIWYAIDIKNWLESRKKKKVVGKPK